MQATQVLPGAGSYHLLVRFTLVGTVLNGRRVARERAAGAVVTGSAAS